MIESIILGAIMGTLTATSGYIKDKMFEPFEFRKFFRSIYISAFGGIACYMYFGKIHPILTMSFSFLFERVIFEIWKAFLRPIQKPGKFNDPQRDTKWVLRRLRKRKG